MMTSRRINSTSSGITGDRLSSTSLTRRHDDHDGFVAMNSHLSYNDELNVVSRNDSVSVARPVPLQLQQQQAPTQDDDDDDDAYEMKQPPRVTYVTI